MSISLSFIRLLFLTICILFSVTFAIQNFEGGLNLINTALGFVGGFVMAGLLMGSDLILKHFNLKAFNTASLGLFFGYLMSEAILFVLTGILKTDFSSLTMTSIRFFIFIFCSYWGMILTSQAAEEWYMSIPFVQLKRVGHKKKDILVDISTLIDSRIIDLASSGLLDHHLILPRFALKDLYAMAEGGDEATKARARRSLDVIKKLEGMAILDLRYVEIDFPEIKDPMAKLIHLARFLDTHILTSDINRIQQASIEGVRIINIHMLSNALKPITQAGEFINIKIQRYGKEARQGVGYLEDGTMVVVNGGAEFIGEMIKTQVLSVKHTSSGRMIFCNACEGESMISEQEFAQSISDLENTHKNYLAL